MRKGTELSILGFDVWPICAVQVKKLNFQILRVFDKLGPPLSSPKVSEQASNRRCARVE